MDIKDSVFIAEGAKIVGDNISIGDDSSVWYNTVIRCSGEQEVTIGKRTNVQDLSLLHTSSSYSVSVGDDVTIGHMSIVHGCTIGNNVMIGMGSTIMDGALIGDNCIIGAGSLITEGKVIPDGSLAFGRPAKVVKELSDEQIAGIKSNAMQYVDESKKEEC